MSLEELDNKLNPKKKERERINPESQLEDKSIPYVKLQMSGSIKNSDIASNAAIAISKTTLGTFIDWTDFTPEVQGGTVTGIGTYTSQVGRYLQLGKTVFFIFAIVMTAHTGSGSARITLPVTSSNLDTFRWIFPLRYTGLAPGDSMYDMVGSIQGNTAYCSLIEVGMDKNQVTLQLEDDTAFSIYGTGFYATD
jgi:hypothetical protein